MNRVVKIFRRFEYFYHLHFIIYMYACDALLRFFYWSVRASKMYSNYRKPQLNKHSERASIAIRFSAKYSRTQSCQDEQMHYHATEASCTKILSA